jgi:hypothetical protein
LKLAGGSSGLAAALYKLDREIKPSLLAKRKFSRYATVIDLPLCLEYEAPAPERFLAWLIQNPSRLNWPKVEESRKASTRDPRRGLKAGARDIIASALNHLVLNGSIGSQKQWWAFEGPTSIDCFIETAEYVIAVEGKRTEPLAMNIHFYKGRNQLARNLEVAQALARSRRYGAILIVEDEKDFVPANTDELLNFLRPALPHFNDLEAAFLAKHFLGQMTWRQVCDATALDFEQLPNTAEDFYCAFSKGLTAE